MALGVGRSDLLQPIMGQGMRLAAAGLLRGGVALLANLVPAQPPMKVEPLMALRNE